MITGRSGSRIFLQTRDSAKAVGLLNDGTDVIEPPEGPATTGSVAAR